MIIDPRRREIRVSEPLLHLGYISFMIERIGGGNRAQRMCASLELELPLICAHELIDAVRRDRHIGPAGTVVADRSELRAVFIRAAFRQRLEMRGAFPGVLSPFTSSLHNSSHRRAWKSSVERMRSRAGS